MGSPVLRIALNPVAGRRSRARGFTLIEIMTVVTIITLMLVIGVRASQAGILQCTRPGGPCFDRQVRNIEIAELNARNLERICRSRSMTNCEQIRPVDISPSGYKEP